MPHEFQGTISRRNDQDSIECSSENDCLCLGIGLDRSEKKVRSGKGGKGEEN